MGMALPGSAVSGVGIESFFGLKSMGREFSFAAG
jgi:hypothetical protein